MIMATLSTRLVDSLDRLWSVAYSSYSPSLIEFAAVESVQFLAFWVPATIYLGINLLFPTFSNRHKIQPERQQPSWEQIRHCVKQVALNEALVIVIQLLVRNAVGWDKTMFIVTGELPSLSAIVFDFAFALVGREVSFYYIHRAFHHPRIYKHIHKRHHTFTAPMSFSAQYVHPVEHLIGNIMPIALPLVLRRAHLLSSMVFVAFELWEAAADHSGFDFVKLPPAQIHDLHHEKSNVNYSTFGIMDWIHGTNTMGWDKPKKVSVD